MAERLAAGAPRVLRSALLAETGAVHGFSLREGGVSRPPFDALNTGATVGDDPEAVAENLRRLAALAGGRVPMMASQVHGTEILEVGEDDDPDAVRHEEADALLTASPGLPVGIRTADCVPILMSSADGRVVAAAHAGWRGTLAGIAGLAAGRLAARAGAGPGTLVAAIGPSIRTGCYEVDPELGARFAGAFGEAVLWRPEPGARPRLDLVGANLRVLEAAGVPGDRIDIVGGCTHCAPARYFSHRRDRGKTGRHLSFVAPKMAGSLT